tara:strand:+ start:6644 stop:8146 length:1503 start_codon:yes stop_codon:yes gene_type:complete
MESRSLPKSIDYSDVLPKAIPAVARRRKFYPQNGTSFNFIGSREIRIEIGSVNSLMDPSHSYLQFECRNTNAAATFGYDIGGGNCLFKNVRVEQGGRVLTEIREYNRLHAAILNYAQDSTNGQFTNSLVSAQRAMNGGAGAGGATGRAANGQGGEVYGNCRHNIDTQIPAGTGYRFCLPIPTGLFTQDKLIPLPLVRQDAPITLVLEMEQAENCGVWSAAPAQGDLSIVNISVNAQLIEVGRDAIEQIKMIQQMSGGQLAISGQDYEHNSDILPAQSTGEQIIRIPARKRSMKSLFFAIQSETFANGAGGMAADNVYNLSYAGCANMLDYQLKVGSVVYPPTPIQAFQAEPVATSFGELNRSESIMELAKALGTLGFRNPTGRLNTITYGVAGNGASGITNGDTGDGAGNTLAPGSNDVHAVCPFGLDLDAFQHTAIEAGVDTETLSQESNLILNIGPGGVGAGGGAVPGSGLQPKLVNMYVLYDQHYYFGADGMVTFSN